MSDISRYADDNGGSSARLTVRRKRAARAVCSRQAASLLLRFTPDCRLMQSWKRVHGSCACKGGNAILVIGPPGSGKSDLVLRLLARGFELVADDQVDVTTGLDLGTGSARAPQALAGLLEVRGLGIVRLPFVERARLALVVELGRSAERMPMPEQHPELGLPVVRLDGRDASAPDRVMLALDCALGKTRQVAGAFAA